MSKKPSSASTAKRSTPSSSVSSTEREEFFNSLADPEDPESISIEGLGTLCEQLGIDASSDIRALVLAQKLGAGSQPGKITRAEFLEGTRLMNVATVAQIQARLPSLDPGFMDRTEFRDFYRFVFQFNREGTHKTIEKSLIMGLLPIVLDSNRAPHLDFFMQFLEQQGELRITLDQWESFLQFNSAIRLDLSNWEEGGAWPLLFDDYVEWRKKNGSA
eukprot:gene10721-7632_t